MSPSEQVRQSLDTTLGQIGEDLERRLVNLMDEWNRQAAEQRQSAVDEAQRAASAELALRVEEAVGHARADWEASHRAQLAEVERLAEERVRRAQAEAEAASQAQARDAVEALAAAERSVRAAGRHAQLAGFDRLLRSIERLDAATSLRATLDALAEGAAAEAARTMVFVVRAAGLQGWYLHGFQQAPAPGMLSLRLAEAGPLAAVVSTAATTPTAVHAFAGPLAFARLDESCTGLAVPVTVDHETIAIVYGDDGGAPDREVAAGWPEAIQVLARHASRRLEALTAWRTLEISQGHRRDE